MKELETYTTIAADHPALAGHFPGNPIVPGVVILDEVITAVTAAWADCRVLGVSSAKFLRPLRPDQLLVITASKTSAEMVRFSCSHDGELIAQGALAIGSL